MFSTDLPANAILEPLLNSFPDIIHSVNKDGLILFTNKTASELLGYSNEELLKMTIYDLYAPEVQSKLRKGFIKLKEEGDIVIRESSLQSKSGEIIPVEIRSFGVYDDNGEFIRTFSILRDIREMKKMRDNLMHAERLTGIGELASCVVHDIHNPLMVIQLYTELLLRDSTQYFVKETQDESIQFLSQMQKATEKIQKLLNHLRTFSRRQSESIEKKDLNQLIDDSLFMVMNKIRGLKIKVERTNIDKTFIIEGYIIQLEQVFMNLISNACDAMANSDKKILKIIIEECEIDDQPYYSCSIDDTGCGIDEANLDNIFHSFFTTKKAGEGTGLGLSICNDILEKHGGTISVTSKVGVGTRFTVLLPADFALNVAIAGK